MTRSVDHPAAMDAEIDILFTGYAHPGEGGLHVAGTVGLVRDGEAVIVIDSGMVPSHRSILEPLAKLGLGPEAVSDVVSPIIIPTTRSARPSSPAPDSTTTGRSIRTARGAEGFAVSPSVLLRPSPW